MSSPASVTEADLEKLAAYLRERQEPLTLDELTVKYLEFLRERMNAESETALQRPVASTGSSN